jgi:hypothetical protein
MPRLAARPIPLLCVLGLGYLAGWMTSHVATPQLRAGGGDRWGDSILTAGSISTQFHEGLKVQVTQDALYFLDYRGGRLLATVPNTIVTASAIKPTGTTKMLGEFAERDLAADFKIDPAVGPTPHFLMTPMSLGMSSGLVAGVSPLCIVETTTSQVALYQVDQTNVGATSKIRIELKELKSMGKAEAGQARQ